MSKFDIGIVGLGTRGTNIALSLAEIGMAVLCWDRIPGATARGGKYTASRERMHTHINVASDAHEFVNALRKPRIVILLLPADGAVDTVLEALEPELMRTDIVVDGGNSHYLDTKRHQSRLAKSCIHFADMGVSGCAEGLRRAPSLALGGSKAAWERLRPTLEAIAARVDGEPCAAWLGPGPVGHYVNMIHKGIEYALMELIAESYDVLRRGFNVNNDELHAIFQHWAEGELGGYLTEITADILARRDANGDQLLIDHIRDVAHERGSGAWAAQEAMSVQVPVPVVNAAVSMRALSSFEGKRKAGARLYSGVAWRQRVDTHKLIEHLGDALYTATLISYAQGLQLLQVGSRRRGYQVDIKEVVRIWRGGCIIGSRALEMLLRAWRRNPFLGHAMFDTDVAEAISRRDRSLRRIVQAAARWGVPTPGFMAALAYFDAYHSAPLPANLIQAQRDYAGRHGVELLDRAGRVHIDWNNGDDKNGNSDGLNKE